MINRLLILRTCAPDGTSRNGFTWPLEPGAPVMAPDWDSDPQRDCGGGLHGLPWGVGDGALLSWEPDVRWLVVEVDVGAGCVGSADKCRFARGWSGAPDRKSTRLNSSHVRISYAVFCLKKKRSEEQTTEL